uniref:Uncharacterized protein n=1 Tax=viral metagenome TaxID=1070528 RepID=A0A6C0EB56_9ZZZZ
MSASCEDLRQGGVPEVPVENSVGRSAAEISVCHGRICDKFFHARAWKSDALPMTFCFGLTPQQRKETAQKARELLNVEVKFSDLFTISEFVTMTPSAFSHDVTVVNNESHERKTCTKVNFTSSEAEGKCSDFFFPAYMYWMPITLAQVLKVAQVLEEEYAKVEHREVDSEVSAFYNALATEDSFGEMSDETILKALNRFICSPPVSWAVGSRKMVVYQAKDCSCQITCKASYVPNLYTLIKRVEAAQKTA